MDNQPFNPQEQGEPAISWSDLAIAAGFMASIAAPIIYAVMKVGPWLWL